MRDYRGKRIDNSEWVYGSLIRKYDKPHKVYIPFGHWIYVNEDECHKVDPETVGQYTGFHEYHDNQDEIYNGDIVELEYEGTKHSCKVQYCGCGYMFVADSLPDGYIWASETIEFDREYCWAEGTKKLGNIYDNPNLLEGGYE